MTALLQKETIESDDALACLVEKIRTTPSDPNKIRPGKGSLQKALQEAPVDLDFNLATWEAAWAKIEDEIEQND